MKTEFEAKFLDVDPEQIRAGLKAIGAFLVFPESEVRQKTYDFPDFRLDRAYSWLRLRDERGQISLTLKIWQKGGGVDGMKEIFIDTNSFEETGRLLLAIGMQVKSTQAKKRELWKLGDVEFMLDTWPWIPPFFEIEGESEESVRGAAGLLHLDWQKAVFGGVAGIYKRYYDVEYEKIDRCPEIIFSEVPDWLEKKRRIQVQ